MKSFQKSEVRTDAAAIEEFLTRGVENIFPNVDFVRARMMEGSKLTLYYGIDPTGPTIHLGHLVPIRKLAAFQKLGHQIIFLIGDFTAMIGDPTDKASARKTLSKEEVRANFAAYQGQIVQFIDFSGPNKATIRYNSEWLAKMGFENVLDLASHMTVDQMLKRDMFKKRMEEGKPIYIHEFMYPLMQGYDSVAMNVDGEIGGNDQTFNMLAGRDLLKIANGKEKFVIAMRLLTDPTGKKMGKTENNMVALNQTPEDMFGKIMSWSDELIIPGFEIVTDVPLAEIDGMEKNLKEGTNPRDFKIRLAKEVVAMCHGKEAAEEAEHHFESTFTKGGVPEDVTEMEIAAGTTLVDALLAARVVASKTEFRRLVSEGAITRMETGEKIADPAALAETSTYKVGKRRFIKLKQL
jgi:tyrosyl-tRNA synthetase